MNANFFIPTKVIMMENCIQKNEALFQDYGKNALIVTGANSAKKNGSLLDVIEALNNMEIRYNIFDKIMANPTVSCVYKGAEFARECKADFIIGIGGGSPMDAAKAIALLAVQEMPEEELFSGKLLNEALPLLLIPTTAGTGSEVTPNAVLTDVRSQTKKSIGNSSSFAKLALLDAKYMNHLSLSVTINTALDALSHAVEGMLSVRATQLSDCLAAESIKKIVPCLHLLSQEKQQSNSAITMDIREKLLYGSMLAGIVIAHTGTTSVHAMGYSLTYFKNIDHGRANALLLPSFLRFVMKSDEDTVEKILSLMEFDTVDALEALFISLLGEREQITEMEIDQYTMIANRTKNVLNSKVVPLKEDIAGVYASSLPITL